MTKSNGFLIFSVIFIVVALVLLVWAATEQAGNALIPAAALTVLGILFLLIALRARKKSTP